MKENIKNEDIQLLSIEQVSQRLGIGLWKTYEQVHSGELKSVRIGTRRLVRARTLNEYINMREG